MTDLERLSNRVEALEQALARLSDQVEQLTLRIGPVGGTRAIDVPTAAVAKEALKPRNRGDRVLRIAVLGGSSQGLKHIESFAAIEGCEIAYVCDPDRSAAIEAAVAAERAQATRPRIVADLREPLLDDSVDVVSVATPNHWHAVAAVWALKAGKHVYLETPLTHALDEGEHILAAARSSRRIVQGAHVARANGSLRAAADFMANGRLGEVRLAQCITYKRRAPLPPTDGAMPEGLDADLWFGPADPGDPAQMRWRYDWHWNWRYGDGALGINGVHRMDAVRFALGLQDYGQAVASFGGRFGPDDGCDAPNVQIAVHRWGEVLVVQDICGLPKKAHLGVRNGVIFYGTQGIITFQSGVASLCDAAGTVISKFAGRSPNPYLSFVESVLAHDLENSHQEFDQLRISTDLCHLGNVSQRLATTATDAQVTASLAQLQAPAAVLDLVPRVRRNLRINDCDAPLMLGPTLALDSRTGQMQGAPEAAALTRAHHRPDFGYDDFL